MLSNVNGSFQEVIPGLFIGSQSALSSPYPLIAKKITHLLSINNCKEKPIGFTIKVMNITDHEDSDIISSFQECINFIKSSKRILVFCAAGRSRSAAVVAAYLIKEKQMSLQEALTTINRVRAVKPNEGFISQLETWEKDSGCRICRVLAQSIKLYEDEDFFVIICPRCQYPMAALKEHCARRTSDVNILAQQVLSEIAAKYCEVTMMKVELCKTAHISWHISIENSTCNDVQNSECN